MKSSSGRSLLLPLGFIAIAALVIGVVRARLVAVFSAVERREDSYYLPGPEASVLLSLGYRAALADLIFAHVLVMQGVHFQEKRRFEFVAQYLDAITTLDPKFREPYRLADTLITLQPTPASIDDFRAARRIDARGLAEFPYDQELWLIAGQYLAYLAAPHVPAAERDEWRLDGAKKLARSCELVGSNENIPHHCITAAHLFNEAGKRDSMRNVLERLLAISDDPEILTLAGGYLGRVMGDAERERAEERNRRFRALWSRDLTFVSREMLTLLGPRFAPELCAGLAAQSKPECATSFRAWGELQDQR